MKNNFREFQNFTNKLDTQKENFQSSVFTTFNPQIFIFLLLSTSFLMYPISIPIKSDRKSVEKVYNQHVSHGRDMKNNSRDFQNSTNELDTKKRNMQRSFDILNDLGKGLRVSTSIKKNVTYSPFKMDFCSKNP